MNKEDKELILKDLCARLPYGVKIYFGGIPKLLTSITIKPSYIEILVEGEYGKAAYCDYNYTYNDTKYHHEEITEKCKPYLRPMSSMTEEECDMVEEILGDKCIFDFMSNGDIVLKQGQFSQNKLAKLYDYYSSIHVDYRGLIPKGLAIEVTKENNPYN